MVSLDITLIVNEEFIILNEMPATNNKLATL